MNEKMRSRWLILGAAMLCNLCIGAAYAWSVFQMPLITMFGWSPSETSLTFTLTLAMMPISMIIAGRIQDKRGPTVVMMIGGILFGIGIILSGFTSSLGFLYLAHGIIGGLGVGTVYSCAVANSVKWFPDKKGLASGLIAAGLGLGAVVFAPIANSLIKTYDVLATFKILGVVYLLAILSATTLIKMPPPNYKPQGWTPPPAAVGVSGLDMGWRQMLADPMFYILWLMYTLGAVSGLMIIGHASPIGQEVVGLSVDKATLAVSILALANTGGRIFWGYVSDRLGRYYALASIYLVSAVAMFLLTRVGSFVPFVLTIAGVGLCFGGLLGIYPTVTADMFGLKNLGQNYGIMFSAFAAAAIIGPRLAARVKETSGGEYSLAFIITVVMGIIGFVLTLFVQHQLKKRKTQVETTG